MRLVKDRVVEHPHRYKLTKVAGTEDVYDLEQVPGTVTDAGTAVNRQLFNSIDSALLCTHSKTGTVHTFTLNSNVAAFVPGQTIYTVKAALTASIEYGDTFTLTDGTTSYTGIVPKTSEGGNYRVTLFQELSPVVIFEVNLGGSAKHAFFRGGGQKRLFREVFTASGSWTCPDFVDEVYVMAFGGGGGGGGGGIYYVNGSAYYSYGGGGGGGYMAQGKVRVTPGTSYAFTIGAGGKGGIWRKDQENSVATYSYQDGSDGSATTFQTITANGGKGGGKGGADATGNGGNGGAGGGTVGGTVGTSGQFGAASGRAGGDGYGLQSKGGIGGALLYSVNLVGMGIAGAGGGASYGTGGMGGSLITSQIVGEYGNYSMSGFIDYFAGLIDGKYGGGGGGGAREYGEILSGNLTDYSSLDGYMTKYSGGHGGDGILFISYYADPSMLADHTPEEFDVQTNGTEVSIA